MSFFDDEDFDEPTRVSRPAEEPRRPRAAWSGAGGGGGGPVPDERTARIRQLTALGVAVVVLILLTVGVRGCVSSSREDALTGYARDVSALLTESRDDVSGPLFEALGSGAAANEVQVELNRLRGTAEDAAQRATDLSPPDDEEGRAAQRNFELAMNLRTRALRAVAAAVPQALGRGQTSQEATERIAGEMEALLASDIIIATRTKPLIDQQLRAAEISGANVEAPRFLTDLAWLQTQEVATRLGAEGATQDRSNQPAAPGTHGHGIQTVTIGDTTLTPGTPVEVPLSGNPTVNVTVQNQGENDERDVPVNVSLAGGGGDLRGTSRLQATTAGQEATAEVRLPSAPATGQQIEMTVQVGAVPGEEQTENNEQTYQVTFTGG